MPLIKICAYEVTSFDPVLPITLTCCDPHFTPVAPGDHYKKGEAEHKCACSCTFLDFCDITGQSACITLPAGATLCPCGCGEPKVTCSATCDPGSIETTPNSVSGHVTISLHVTNLCDPTTVCVETAPCIDDRIKYYAG